MADIFVYDKIAKEREQLIKGTRNYIALMSDDHVDLHEYDNMPGAYGFISRDEPCDMAITEIGDNGEVALAQSIREHRDLAELMVVADREMSPMKYLNPRIRACSLLLRPFEHDEMKAVLKDFVGAYFRSTGAYRESNEAIVIDNRQGQTTIHCSHIYYIEVREKKVYIRLRDKEYSMYSTLESIKERLPNHFMECHRSYMFNTGYLERVKLSDNTIYLEHGITVPLSRSYKSKIKEYLDGLSGQ